VFLSAYLCVFFYKDNCSESRAQDDFILRSLINYMCHDPISKLHSEVLCGNGFWMDTIKPSKETNTKVGYRRRLVKKILGNT
jgi:hypothetical protein